MAFYQIDSLLKTKADYLMLLGERSNGKSYAVKETILNNAFKNDEKFIYLRRWNDDIKQLFVNAYFEDMPISKITKRKFNHVKAINGNIYFTKESEGKIKERKLIGRYCALNLNERYKSQAFVGYTGIVYEEFITNKLYINDEPSLLQQFVSTVFRVNKGTVYLVGNTLSRVCPYFSEWCLENVLKQKQGTIDIYNFTHKNKQGEEVVTSIAVEYCESANHDSGMYFGQSAQQIINGQWETKEYPKLPRKEFEYDKVYEILIEYQSFKFVLELLCEPRNGGLICYVYPYTKKRKIYRIITDEFSDLPNKTPMLNKDIRPEVLISQCLRLNKICFSDNLTGSDFNKVLEKLRI